MVLLKSILAGVGAAAATALAIGLFGDFRGRGWHSSG
jgi:hypothetical protein